MSSSSWVNCMPDGEIEHFTERSEKRRQLFEDAASRLPTTSLSPLIWAFFQVCDLDSFKELTRNKFSWMNVYRQAKEAVFESQVKDTIYLWKQRSAIKDETSTRSKRSFSAAFRPPTPSQRLQSQVTTPAELSRAGSGTPLSGGPEYSVRPDEGIAALCKDRDRGLCVISGLGGVEACHIYPWCAFGVGNASRVENFWETLGMFWPEEKVNLWHDKIFRDGRTHKHRRETETVENMITLTSTLHRFHSEGAFALRPVRMSADKTQLELEFHWLAPKQRDSTVRVDLMEEPMSSRGRTESRSGVHFARLHQSGVVAVLMSGDRFTMTTDDPEGKPLPDPGLLELQWHLQRVLTMSGAAGWKDEDINDGMRAFSDEQWQEDQAGDDCPN